MATADSKRQKTAADLALLRDNLLQFFGHNPTLFRCVQQYLVLDSAAVLGAGPGAIPST